MERPPRVLKGRSEESGGEDRRKARHSPVKSGDKIWGAKNYPRRRNEKTPRFCSLAKGVTAIIS
jgi:hypothetical protein